MSSKAKQGKIKILSETLASRCDSCHQIDLYDPTNNTCLRCEDLNDDLLIRESVAGETPLFSHSKESTFHPPETPKQERVSLKDLINLDQLNKGLFAVLTALSIAVGLVLGFFFPAIYYVSKYGLDTSYTTENPMYAEHLELSLTNPETNPPIILSLNNVTTLEFDEKILQVVSPINGFVEVVESTSPNKIYLIGKNPKPFSDLETGSGNLIIETKSTTFTLYFDLTHRSYPGAFNTLVSVKKQTLNNSNKQQE